MYVWPLHNQYSCIVLIHSIESLLCCLYISLFYYFFIFYKPVMCSMYGSSCAVWNVSSPPTTKVPPIQFQTAINIQFIVHMHVIIVIYSNNCIVVLFFHLFFLYCLCVFLVAVKDDTWYNSFQKVVKKIRKNI